MPASLFGELDQGVSSGGGGVPGMGLGAHTIEDQRAFQLALELSMLGLSDAQAFSHVLNNTGSSGNNGHDHFGLSGSTSASTNHSAGDSSLSLFSSHHNVEDLRSLFPKKSQNMTECVPVPSSEHVAEIVGRQGCKIKALRAKTNTYIKTPVRGEEPVFVVTGRKEDVAQAKREILSAAEHFSQIRASRKGGSGSSNGSESPNGNGNIAPTPVPGQITIQVRVPYRVVGLVVGPKGATIKRIQNQTHTYIVTPSRDKDPVFEVTGLPDNVQVAKREIEAHIAIRTGALPLDNHGTSLDELSTSQIELLASLYAKSGGNFESLSFGLFNSLSSSLSSVGNSAGSHSVGSSSSGGGSLSSLSSLNGFNTALNNNGSNGGGGGVTNGGNGMSNAGLFGGMTDLSSFSILDNAAMSSSRSEDSYLFGGSGPNSIGGSQTKLTDLFAANAANGGVIGSGVNGNGRGVGSGEQRQAPGPGQTNVSVGSSLWGSFDQDEGLGDSPTLENGSTMWPELRASQSPPGLTLTHGSSADKSE